MRRFLSWSLVVSAALISAGCGAAADSLEDSASESGRSRAALVAPAHGPVKLVAQAFADVPLDDAQRAEIEKLAEDAEGRHKKVFEAKKDALLALADQVESGRVDRSKLLPKATAITAALKASRAEDRAAVMRLHALLDEDQREDLVEAVEDRIKDRFKGRRGEGGPRAIAERLGIDDDQREAIMDAVKKKMREGRSDESFFERIRKSKAALEAFEDDDFDLDEVMPVEEIEKRTQVMTEKVLGITEVVVPLLTAEQRQKAAALIREKAAGDGGF
jgi:Spy/CpxP family protein refolding chaperone